MCRFRRITVTAFLAVMSLWLCAAPSSNAARTVEVSGTVVETQNGQPVVGAVLRLDKDYLWTVSDAEGRYTFHDVQAGTYTMEVSCLGYVTVSQTVEATKNITGLTIRLSENSLALNEVVVTAERAKDGLNTSHTVGRNALDHLQISDMSNISALLPGGKTINPDLTTAHQMTIRSGGTTTGNAAFGTAVEVDGVRLGDNADFTGMSGTATRSIAVENIESVEVITGVPSAEYGDLGSGIVKVNTKKGRAPVTTVFSVNPRTYEASVSFGVDLGTVGKESQSLGVLNVSAEWANATKKLDSPYSSYTRRGATVEYSNTFHKVLRLEAGVTGNLGGMNTKDDPDAFSGEYTKEHDNVLRTHAGATWLLNKSWVTNFKLEGSINYHDQLTHERTYNSFASSQPSVHSEIEGYYLASSLPLSFLADKIIDSKELDYAASLKYDWQRMFGKTKSKLKAGIQYKADGNVGKGEYYQDPALAANGYRPRPYSDYPYLHNLALFAEEDYSFPLGATQVELSAGLRFENSFLKDSEYDHMQTLSPRLNAKWQLTENLSVHGGWGTTSKLPSFFILYPQQEYRDIQTFGYSYGSTGSTQYVYYTQPYKMATNSDLRWQKNINSELGFDLEVLNTKISLVGFYNITRDPYEFTDVYTPFSYNIMSLPSGFAVSGSPEIKVDSQTGQVYMRGSNDEYWTPMTLKVTDRSFASSQKQENGNDIRRAGAELTIDFPEIPTIRTALRLDASYNYSSYVDDRLSYYYNTGWSHSSLSNRSYQYVGIYARGTGNSTYNGKTVNNVDANLTSITHIPQARLVITCRLEAALVRHIQNKSTYNGKDYAFTVSQTSNAATGGNINDGDSYTAIWPVAYMDLDGNIHEFTATQAGDAAFSNLILKSGNAYIFNKDGYDPYLSANLSITKEIGNHVSLSFFANNFTNSRRFVKSYATGVSAIFTPDFYYGLTCRVKF